MDFQKTFDYVVGGCGFTWGCLAHEPWIAILGAALVLWRSVQAFILEPLGIFWPQPKDRRNE